MYSNPDGEFLAGHVAPQIDQSHGASSDGWAAAYDHNSQAWYYYNLVTGDRSWEPPAGWVSTGAAEGAAAEVHQAPSGGGRDPAAQDYSYNVPLTGPPGFPGYYYTDANGIDQGPFTKEQLIAWRGSLPMDLQVWYQDDKGAKDEEETERGEEEEKEGDEIIEKCPKVEQEVPQVSEKAKEGGNRDKSAQSSADELLETVVRQETVGRAPLETEEGAAAAAEKQLTETAPGETTHQQLTRELRDLAEILGDVKLLAQWREENPDAAGATCAAPTAVAYELDQKKDSYTSLAEAVVAGLPQDDEAVQLAWAAASAGQSLHSVVEWSRQQGEIDYTATALHAGKVGRVQAATGERESIYADMGSWIDPRKMEEQLEKAKNREKRKLTSQEVRAVRQKKQEMKEKKLRAWLFE